MTSPHWSEMYPHFFHAGFLWQKKVKKFLSNFFSVPVLSFLFYQPRFGCLLCKNNWKWLNTGNCFDTYNITWVLGLEFLGRIFGITKCQVNGNYRDGSRNNESPAEKLGTNAKNALIQRKIGHPHDFRQATAIIPQSTLMRSGEYNIIAFFFHVGRVMRQLPTLLKQ